MVNDWLPLTLMLQIGTVKSPTGTRASIADSDSHYDIHCKRWAVVGEVQLNFKIHIISLLVKKLDIFRMGNCNTLSFGTTTWLGRGVL